MNLAKGAIIVGLFLWTHFSIKQWHDKEDDKYRSGRSVAPSQKNPGFQRSQQRRLSNFSSYIRDD
jgi:nitrogen fixation-related uncharacterized protein